MQVERLTSQHTLQWADLLAICFERSPEEMARLLDWLHLMYEPVSYGIWIDDKLVAQYTALYRQLDFCGTSVRVGMSVNMAVHPDYRGRGLVKHMANPVYDTICQWGALIGMGFSNAAGVKVDKRSKGYGYHVVGQMLPTYGYMRNFRTDELEIADAFPDAIQFSTCVNSDTSAIQFPKDRQFLKQRYALHPFRQYHYALWCDANTVHGIVIFRYRKTFGVKSAAILDVYAEDMPELLKRWSTTMQKRGIRLVQVLTAPQSHIKREMSKLIPLLAVPYAREPYYLTVKPLQDEYPDLLDDFSAWNLIGGDVL